MKFCEATVIENPYLILNALKHSVFYYCTISNLETKQKKEQNISILCFLRFCLFNLNSSFKKMITICALIASDRQNI